MPDNSSTPKPRGFAAMPEAKAADIRRRGGLASPMKFKSGDKRASELGRRGGQNSKRPQTIAL